MNKVSGEIMIYVGIDVSKEKLDCAWLRNIETDKVKSKVFNNNAKGFQTLIEWLERNTQQSLEKVHFIMEATSIYHELLAYTLHETGAKISVVNPAHVRDYAKSLGTRIKTDKKDSVILARYGATQSPNAWQPEAVEIRQLKALIARHEAIEKDIQREINRLEKAQITQVSIEVIGSMQTVIAQLSAEKERIRKLIDDHIDQHPQLKLDRKYLESIPSVGPVVSRYMVALFRSRNFTSAKQYSAFIGLNPVTYESGSSVRGRSRLSKTGNAKIRAKLYMAAIVAIKHNPDIKQQYERLLRKGKTKMAALCAAMRKLVQICFGVLKHQTQYQSQVA